MGGGTLAIEIKLTSDPTRTMLQGLQKASDLIGASRRILICKTAEEIRSDALLVTNLPSFLQELAKSYEPEAAAVRLTPAAEAAPPFDPLLNDSISRRRLLRAEV